MENDTNYLLPYSWISPAFPKNLTLRIKYTFKYRFYANCSDNALGYLKIGFFGYRNGKETPSCLMCSDLSPTIRNSSSPSPLTWYKDISGEIEIEKGDRVVLKILLVCLIQGRFWIGLDCLTYPTSIVDPETVTLRPESTTYAGSVGAWFGASCNSSLHIATDDITPDNDSSFTSSRGCSCPPYGCTVAILTYRLGLPNGAISSGSSINSVTHYFFVRREVYPEGNIRLGIFIGSTFSFDDWAHPPDIIYTYYNKEWAQNPDTALNWTVTDIDNLELSCQLYGSYFFGFYFFTRCTQHYLIVEYEPPVAVNWELRYAFLFFFLLIVFVLILVTRSTKK